MGRRATFAVLAAWLVAAPVLLASVPEADVGTGSAAARFFSAGGGYAVFRLLGYLCLALVLPALLVQSRERLAPGDAAGIFFPLAALLLLGALQLVPLPLALHGFFAPAHARDLAALVPGTGWAPISTDPGLTREAVVRLFLLLVAALAVLHSVRTPRRGWILLGVISGVAAGISLYGILEARFFSDTVLGFAKPGDAGAVTGTFFYRGNFAAFAAAGAGIAAAGLVVAWVRGRRRLAFLALMAVAALLAGVFLSHSRAGLAAAGLATAAGLALPLRRRAGRLLVAGVALVAVVGGGLLVPSVRTRFSYLKDSASASFLDVRVPAWAATLDLFAGRPVLGAGLGAFRRAIHLTQSPENPDELWFAHSDPLNLLAEGGVVGLLFGLAVAILGLLSAVRLARDGAGLGLGVGAASAAGLAGLGAMALVDFPLQIPATALVFAVLAFLPAAVSSGPPAPSPRAGLRGLLAGTASFAVAGMLLLSVAEDYRRGLSHPGTVTEGEALLGDARGKLKSGEYGAARGLLESAREEMPFDGEVRWLLANLDRRDRRVTEWQDGVRAARRLAHGRAGLLFGIGRGALSDRFLYDLALDAIREAGATNPRYFPAAMEAVPSASWSSIVPDRGWAWAQLGDRRAGEGRPDLAIEAYREAISRGERGDVLRRAAAAFRAAGREPEGRAEFTRLGLAWPE